MAAIAVTLVQLRKRENIARHEMIRLDTEHIRLRRIAQQQDSDLGRLINPRELARRAKAMDITPDRPAVHLAGPADRTRNWPNRRAQNQ